MAEVETRIRPAGPDDWQAFRAIRLRALEDSPDSFGRTLAEARRESDGAWRERLVGPSPTLLAVRGDRPVSIGGAFAPSGSTAAWLWGMWTEPAFRGRGLGRRIVGDLVAWAHGAGRTPYLHVTEGNDGARALYVSCGFAPTGVWEPLREGSDLLIEEMVLRRGSQR